METLQIIILAISQWTATASTLYLVWWAAQTRDAAAFRIIALALVLIPALVGPIISIPRPNASMTEHMMLLTFFFGGIAVLRAIFLIVWAIVSKDGQGLRVGGGIVAAVGLIGLVVQIGAAYLTNR
jgi:hypothetical protein